MFEWIMDPNARLALGTLTILEIVLGIDNIIFLSLVVAKLPKAQQNKARRLGLAAAMIMRTALLASIARVIRLTHPLFTVLDHAVSARDLILLLGAVPDLESQQRDPRNHRGHGRRAPHQGAQLLRRDRADHAARYYLQSGLGDYRRGPFRPSVHHDGGSSDRRRCDDVRRPADR